MRHCSTILSRLPPAPPNRPFVYVNMSMTTDGKIATSNRQIASFSSRKDQEHLYLLRTRADAVMCGARTASQDDVTLDVGGDRFRRLRQRLGLAPHHLRILVSGAGSVSPRAAIFRQRLSPVIVLTTECMTATRRRRLEQAADAVMSFGRKALDLEAALRWLRQRWNVRRLLCEGGGELNAALFRANLVDELHLTICPWIFGGQNAPTIAEGEEPRSLLDASSFRIVQARVRGDEMFVVLQQARRRTTVSRRTPT